MHFKHTSFLLLIALLLGPAETVALQSNTNGNVNMALVLQGGPDGTKEGTENALALQGAKEACTWNLPTNQGFQYKTCTLRVLTPASETLGAYAGLIPSKANENDFLMALGYFPSKAIQTAANANGNKLFAIADFEFTPPVGNIVMIGGVDQPSVRRQVNGFGSGVKISCSTCQAYGVYAGTFEQDPKLSATVSRLLIDKKVSVVFNAASIFGTMTLKNLTTQQGVYAIGSGSDEWVTNWAYGSVPGSECVLSSVQTDYTVLVRNVFQSVLRANLTGGATVFYGVNTDPAQSAIKLAPAHEATGVYTAEIQDKMQKYIGDMAKGKLKTGVDHKSGDSRNSGESSRSVELLSLNDGASSSGSGDRNSTAVDGSPKDSHSGGSALFLDGGVTWVVWTVVGFVVVQAMFTAGL
ncbi:hypothetical protein BG006_001270 [Podila minutissima]|uniref:ABC transporter substrate-binding protein PnrA-like domain-containing protein n=1 Tax=Podila minutissima TaxID=64525 RepID=A0A9P5SD07_9FUNG|nr:hypothetical protein BG006_001270 [Podila minutissima]